MKIDTYVSELIRNKYLHVPAGFDLAATPADKFGNDFSKVKEFRKDWEAKRDAPLIGFDVQEITRQIADRGYAISEVTITITRGGTEPRG